MILGLSGFSESGKDTTANYLIENHGFVRVAFADKLREFCYQANPTIHYGEHFHKLQKLVDDFGWEVAKREYIEVREFLQSTGHGARQVFGDMFWINLAFTTNAALNNDRIVVPDVRYLNETEFISQPSDGFIIRVERETIGPVNDHITEQPLPFDYKLNNPEGNLNGLHSNIDELVSNLSKIMS